MKENTEHQHVRRTSKDYSLSFKLAVIREIENGELGISSARRKCGIQSTSISSDMARKIWYKGLDKSK